jgi:hypothetical protein
MGSRGSGSKGRATGTPAAGGGAAPGAVSEDQEFALNVAAANEALREDELWGVMSNFERAALMTYTGESYVDINQHARDLASGKVKKGEDPDMDVMVARIQNAVNKATLSRDVMLYRGFKSDSLVKAFDAGTVVGTTIKNDAFSSTSSNRGIAEGFTSHTTGVIVRMVMPKGYKGAMPLHKHTQNEGEKEFLLKHGTNFKVVSAETRAGKGHYSKIQYRYLTVVPVD